MVSGNRRPFEENKYHTPSSGSQKTHLWEQNLPPSTSLGHWFIQPMFIAHLLCAYWSHRHFLKGT